MALQVKVWVLYSSKNQRVFIEREPVEEIRFNISSIDNFYETDFKPNLMSLKESIFRYHLNNNKQEMEIRCAKTERCGKYNSNERRKLKKF